jgi:hypothetical protein
MGGGVKGVPARQTYTGRTYTEREESGVLVQAGEKQDGLIVEVGKPADRTETGRLRMRTHSRREDIMHPNTRGLLGQAGEMNDGLVIWMR